MSRSTRFLYSYQPYSYCTNDRAKAESILRNIFAIFSLTQFSTSDYQILLRVCKFYKQVFTRAILLSIIVLWNIKLAFAHSGHGSEIMQEIIQQDLTPNLVIAGLGIRFLFGAGQALTLGHRKIMLTAPKP